MAKVELKQPIVDEIKSNLDGAQAVVLVDHRGLTVAEDTDLRKQLRENDIVYKVYKNTMINLAIKDTDYADLSKDLEGPTAMAVSKTDATAPARVICKFAKNAPALEVKSGFVDGLYYDAKGIETLSKVPSKEELLSKLLGSIQSPITNFARVIKQVAEQKDSGAAPAEATEAAEAPAEA
ncbi:MAG: 50S ribosomal protein L10 [Lachnospiraceae bacterium]|nr:50S ribosomal protein L10 [Lachnospiraceae bacterium]